MHHAHRILHGDALYPSRAMVLFCPAEAGQNQGIATMHKVAAIEFRADLDRKIAVLQRGKSAGRIRRGECEIAAHSDEDLDLAASHGRDHANGIEPLLSRGGDPTRPIHPGKPRLAGAMIDSARAVALNVRMSADRAGACAFAPDVS